MAFTSQQTVKIRFYLGYPNILIYKNPRLEGAIEVVGANPDAQGMVETLLAQLDKMYGASPGAPSQIDAVNEKAGLSAVESASDRVEFGTSGKGGSSSSAQLDALRDVGKQLAGALSSFMGVPIGSNVFGTQGYVADNLFHSNGMFRVVFIVGGTLS
jgi:hypothetical protein